MGLSINGSIWDLIVLFLTLCNTIKPDIRSWWALLSLCSPSFVFLKHCIIIIYFHQIRRLLPTVQLARGRRTSLEVSDLELHFTSWGSHKTKQWIQHAHSCGSDTDTIPCVLSEGIYRSPSPPKGELLKDRRPVLSIFVSLCLSKCNQMPPIDLNLWQGTYLISSNSHQSLRGRQW